MSTSQETTERELSASEDGAPPAEEEHEPEREEAPSPSPSPPAPTGSTDEVALRPAAAKRRAKAEARQRAARERQERQAREKEEHARRRDARPEARAETPVYPEPQHEPAVEVEAERETTAPHPSQAEEEPGVEVEATAAPASQVEGGSELPTQAEPEVEAQTVELEPSRPHENKAFVLWPSPEEEQTAERAPEVVVAEPEPERPGRPSLRRPVAALGVVVLGVVVWGVALGGFSSPAQVSIRSSVARGERLFLDGGRADLAHVARQLASVGRPEALVRSSDGAYLLSMPVEIRPGAALVVEGVELRLLSSPERIVGLEARGGQLLVRDATVTSWDPATGAADAEVADGRAYLLALDGATMDVVRSTIRMLGYDTYERYGVSWRTAGTGGTISESTFT
nr:hypothetical protein [Actinomycetota bacterium]